MGIRNIEFRGKRVDNGEWVYGVPYAEYMICGMTTAYYDDEVPMSKCSEFDYIEVIPETVGEYTGLTDKNGTKIFEGDTIEFDKVVRCEPTLRIRGKVFFEQETSAYSVEKNFVSQPQFLCDLQNIEVIGNTHDNPELLKGGAE